VYGHWANASVTSKLVAPAGKVFDGGRVWVNGFTYWGSRTVTLYATSGCSSNGWGDFSLAASGALYGEDTHSTAGSFVWSDWYVDLPVGASEVYITVYHWQDNGNSYMGIMQAQNVTFTPEPATMALLVLGSLGLIRRKR
jgi:hypothetical protein